MASQHDAILESPRGKELVELWREDRTSAYKPEIMKHRRDYEVIRVFSAFRELVEMARGGLT